MPADGKIKQFGGANRGDRFLADPSRPTCLWSTKTTPYHIVDAQGRQAWSSFGQHRKPAGQFAGRNGIAVDSQGQV